MSISGSKKSRVGSCVPLGVPHWESADQAKVLLSVGYQGCLRICFSKLVKGPSLFIGREDMSEGLLTLGSSWNKEIKLKR